MWFSVRSLVLVVLMIVAAAAYIAHPRVDFETVRSARSDPFDAQYANNFYRGYGSDSRFAPGADIPEERYW